MKNLKKEKLWYNPSHPKNNSLLQLSSETAGMDLDHLTAFQEGRSLLASYCRFYSSKH